MIKYLSLYYEFFKLNLKASIEYRIDFFIGAISSLLVQLSGFFFIWMIFKNADNLKGWSFYEMALIYGFLVLSRAFNNMFFDNLWVLGTQYIRTGNFDTILLKPVNALFHLIASKVKVEAIGNMILGIVLLIKSIYELEINISFNSIIFLTAAVFCGTLIFASINLIASAISFWAVDSYHVVWAAYSISELALYPADIFSKPITILVTWIIPYAFVSFYPATFLLEERYRLLSFFTPVVAFVLSITAVTVWKAGLKNYTSTGS